MHEQSFEWVSGGGIMLSLEKKRWDQVNNLAGWLRV